MLATVNKGPHVIVLNVTFFNGDRRAELTAPPPNSAPQLADGVPRPSSPTGERAADPSRPSSLSRCRWASAAQLRAELTAPPPNSAPELADGFCA